MNNKVIPSGWLAEFLKTQKSGLTGHIEKALHPFNESYWGSDAHSEYKGVFWWPYEQTAYYIDGLTRTAILLRDEELLAKAESIIYSVINDPDEDGYLGPKEIKEVTDQYVRWSHAVFFRACLALYEYNHDEKIINAMIKHYLGYPCDYSRIRNVCNVEIILELYRHSGNSALLEMAEDAYVRGRDNEVNRAVAKRAADCHVHGVTYNEYMKLGAMLYRATGNRDYLRDSLRAVAKINRSYMLPGGCCSSSEQMVNDLYHEVYELCNISDMTWSLQYIADATDKVMYLDMIEKCIFNAGIGSVTEDFRGLQYFSCANQIIFNETSSHCHVNIGGKSMAYSPRPMTACCSGNVNRFMPNYIWSLWIQRDKVITARMYGPSTFTGEINGKPFSIEEKTAYPFDLSAEFEIKTKARFTLRLRIPEWCTGFKLSGAEYTVKGGYALVKVKGNTSLSLVMEADIVAKENHGGIYFTRGPLVYSLGMKGERETHGDAEFPTYRIKPDKKWNYGVIADKTPEYQAGSSDVWDVETDLPSITVCARAVKNWRFRTQTKIHGVNWQYQPIVKTGAKWTFNPTFPKNGKFDLDDEVVSLKLVPYGAAKVRITVMPKI